MLRKLLVVLALAAVLASCVPARSAAGPDSTAAPQPWWRSAVFYEIFVRSFYDTNGDGIGDLNGVTTRLDYLSNLGVNAIWLMPVQPSPSYHGYDVTDYYAVNPQYGTMDDLKRLLAEAHKRGMHVIIDLVINHTSSQHPFFLDAAAKGPGSKYYNWYIWSDTNQGRYWHALPADPSRYYFGIFCDCMPDLNYRNPEVTAEADKISAFWIKDVGVDGFRMDAAKHLIEDGTVVENTPETHEWLKGFYKFYKAQNPDAYVVGEVGSADASLVKTYAGAQLDQTFNFELARDFVDSAREGTSVPVNSGLVFAGQAMPDGNYASFLTNHDQDRVMSTLGGNVQEAKLAAFLLLTSPGTPYIYYGEEIGMQGVKPDEDIRRPMQWSADANAGFTTGTPWRAPAEDFKAVNVRAESASADSLLSFYRHLITARKAHRALQVGQLSAVNTGNPALFAAVRTSGGETLLVLVNLSSQPISEFELTGAAAGLNRGSYTATDLLEPGRFADLKLGSDGQIASYRPLDTIPAYGMYILTFSKR